MKTLALTVLLVNALISVVIGALLLFNTPGELVDLGLTDHTAATGTFYGLGLTILLSASFSLLAAYWVLSGQRAARALTTAIGFVLVATAVGLYALADIRLTLVVDGVRGLIVLAAGLFVFREPSAD